jgi:uncharacterized membrane protein
MKKVLVSGLSLGLLSLMLTGCYYDKEVNPDAGGLPTNVSFSNDVQPVFTKNCAMSGCHDAVPTHNPSLVLGSSYGALASGGYLNTAVPSAGILYQEISEGNMPPGAPLTSHEANLIIAWLNEGAKNN